MCNLLTQFVHFLTVPESAPVNLTSLPANTTALTVSWLPVIEEDRNGIILGHWVSLSNITGEFIRNISFLGSEVLTVILGRLEVWTNYSMQVCAFTVKGNGPWSGIIRGITDEEGKKIIKISRNSRVHYISGPGIDNQMSLHLSRQAKTDP